jgi:hypothetical protein
MEIDLQSLYETLLVGTSPCHGFTKVSGHIGSFYHVVCHHGVSTVHWNLWPRECAVSIKGIHSHRIQGAVSPFGQIPLHRDFFT